MALATYFQVEFYATFLRATQSWLYWSAVISIALNLALKCMFIWAPAVASNRLLALVGGTLTQGLVVALLWRGGRGNKVDAALLLIPNCVMFALNLLSVVCHLPGFSSNTPGNWICIFLAAPFIGRSK